jgi:hypothetical protein
MGYVRSIDPDARELVIEFEGKPVKYQFGELDQVASATLSAFINRRVYNPFGCGVAEKIKAPLSIGPIQVLS